MFTKGGRRARGVPPAGRSTAAVLLALGALGALAGVVGCAPPPGGPGTPTTSTTAPPPTTAAPTTTRPPVPTTTVAPTTSTTAPPATTTTAAPGPGPGAGCGRVTALLEPTCGAWFGVYARTDRSYGWNPTVPLEEIEAQVGRRFDVVHSYRDMSNQGRNGVFPDSYDREQVAAGRILKISWESRIFSSGTTLTWRQIYDGSHDATIDAVGARLAAWGEPVFLTFDHEPEDEPAKGTDAEYVRAWRHVHDRITAAGADNVIWVWTMMGYSGHYSRYKALYPGDEYVDWIGYDPYNFYVCTGNRTWKSPYDTVHPFYAWLEANHLGDGKPIMLSEYGTAADPADPEAKRRWFEAWPAAVKAHPRIKAVLYFNSAGVTTTTDTCNMLLNDTPSSIAGFSTAAADPYFTQPHG